MSEALVMVLPISTPAPQPATRVASARALETAVSARPSAVYVLGEVPLEHWLSERDWTQKTAHRVLLARPKHRDLAFLDAVFDEVIAGNDEVHLLSGDVLRDVVESPARPDLVLGWSVSQAGKTVVLVRGNLERLVVPFSAFVSRPKGPKPDFKDVEVIDGGQTLRLGAYEAAVSALLYEHDAAFRKKERKRHVAEDTSFGASLRRLRLQKGLSREDFGDMASKTIARLERNEVKAPHRATLEALAIRLGVAADELGDF